MNGIRNGSLKIAGSGSSVGGSFDSVNISGSGKINGDIDCNNFKVSGSCRVDGSVKTDRFKASGSAEISGTIESNEFRVSGGFRSEKSVKTKTLHISGEIKCDKISAETIESSGGLKVNENVNAENFTQRGAFKIGGMLNAGNIEIHMYDACCAKEIGGEKITIKRAYTFGFKRIFKAILNIGEFSGLTTSVIEGDEIYLEGVKADIVRGKNVNIGGDCEIGLVEYTNSFYSKSETGVKEYKKI